MFKLENNQKIGNYLNSLITKKYTKVRRFCIAYLQKSGIVNPTDEEIGKMQNRMSQIIKGNKGIQTYDLPIFCDLLNVSCEQILSCGKCYVPISGHITNYEIAFSKSKKVWKEYIEREDKLFLNPDEYNRTVIDYALEFKNYDFLKFLMDNKYIWFVDINDQNCLNRARSFFAGTSIKRREIGYQDTLDTDLRYHGEQLGLRQKMIALAMENGGFEMLNELHAREILSLYQLCVSFRSDINCKDYYDENVIEQIANSNVKVLEYFSDEFTIVDRFGNEHQFVYPFLSQVLDKMIKENNQHTEYMLKRAIDHNNHVQSMLSSLLAEAIEAFKDDYNCDEHYKIPVEETVKSVMRDFIFYDDDGFLSYSYLSVNKHFKKFCTNIIRASAKSKNALINDLIEKLNNSYENVCEIQPDTSNY